MRTSRRYEVLRLEQLAALASPTRQEIVDVLERLGEASAAGIASALGREADGLYYHLRALERVGLIVPAATRVRGGREEAWFRTVSPELALRYGPPRGPQARAVRAIVASMLRLGIRDFGRAHAGGGAVVEGPRRELWALRATGRLSPAAVGRVNRGIRRLRDSVASGRGGRLYAITILLTPLDHRARKRQRRPRRARASQ
jgi:DNA-binding transcriptional ArsR family regulator